MASAKPPCKKKHFQWHQLQWQAVSNFASILTNPIQSNPIQAMEVASFRHNRIIKQECVVSNFFTNIKNNIMMMMMRMKIRETVENLPPLNFKLGDNSINTRNVMSCDMYVCIMVACCHTLRFVASAMCMSHHKTSISYGGAPRA